MSCFSKISSCVALEGDQAKALVFSIIRFLAVIASIYCDSMYLSDPDKGGQYPLIVAFIIALTVDGFLLATTEIAVRSPLKGAKKRYLWGLIVLFTFISTRWNVLYLGGEHWVMYWQDGSVLPLMILVTSVVQSLSVESKEILKDRKESREWSRKQKEIDKAREHEKEMAKIEVKKIKVTPVQPVSPPSVPKKSPVVCSGRGATVELREKLQSLIDKDPSMTVDGLAEHTGLTRSKAYRIVTQHLGVKYDSNTSRWQKVIQGVSNN